VVVALVASLALAACSDDGDTTPTTSTQLLGATTTVPADDGILRVGAVLPSGGTAPDMGVSMRAALALAEAEVNAAGGVFGRPIDVKVVEEGDSPAAAELAVQELVRDGYDAIIGPTSSLHLLETLDTTIRAGVFTCAPTASALSLDEFPTEGLLIRTVPSDSLQATAIARVADDTGRDDAVVVYLDDGYGRPFAAAVERELRLGGTTVLGGFAFTPGDVPDPTAIASVGSLNPGVVVVVGDGVTGPAIVNALDDAVPGSDAQFVVNDAMRRPDAAAAPYGADLASRILGVSPLAHPQAGSFRDALVATDPTAGGLYAANVYDCLNLIALAAQVSESTVGAAFAGAFPSLSANGSSCPNYAQCLDILDSGRDADYDGPMGFLTIDDRGLTTSAVFDVFGVDPDTGRDVHDSFLTIGDV
jgi:branched-chain amino acid transport system substrate-binding protein